jgi:hypothetical protein
MRLLSVLFVLAACGPELPVAQEVRLKAAGLFTHPNQLDLPEGALVQADNIVIRRDGVIEPRRGQSHYAAEVFDRLFSYRGTLLGRNDDDELKHDNGSGTFTAKTGTCAHPDASAKMRAAEAAQNLYLTTSAGVYRLDSPAGTPELAGAPMAPGFERDQRVATAAIGGLVRASNVVTATTSTAHGFYVGQVVNMNSAGEANFAKGNKTVASVPSASSFTYAEAGANASSAAPQTFLPAALVTSGGYLADGNQAAYRLVFNAPDANNTEKPGAASPRVVIANADGTPGWVTAEAKNVVLRAFVPSNVKATHSVRLYRSKQVPTSIVPEPEYQLVWEALVKDGDIVRGWVDITDITPDDLRGDTLYVSDSQEGEDGNNFPPPLARDVVAFKERLLYGRTTQPATLTLSLLGVGGASGLQNGDVLDIVADGWGGFVSLTATTGTPTTALHFRLETSGTVSQNIRNTALNLCAAINRNPGPAWALYASAATDPPGRIALLARSPAYTSLRPFIDLNTTVNSRFAFMPPLNPGAALFDLSRAGSTVTATSVVGAVGFVVGESVTFAGGNADFPPGAKVVTAVTTSTFTYTEAGNPGAGPRVSISPTNYVKAEPDVGRARVYESKPGQPDAVPLLDYEDLGSEGAELLKMVALRDSVFAFKEDGLYRGVDGGVGMEWRLFDPTIILLAPDSAVALGNQVYALTTQGVVAISDTGSEIVSRPIERTLLALQQVGLSKLKQLAFAVARETEREYELRVPASAADDHPTQAYVYNTITNTWVRDTIAALHGLQHPADDRRYLAGALSIDVERKTLTGWDYNSDGTVTAAIIAAEGNEATLDSAAGVSAGDVLDLGGLYAILAVSGDTLTLDASIEGFTGPCTIRKTLMTAVRWAPVHGGAPGSLKLFRELNFLMGNAYVKTVSLSFATELVGQASVDADVLGRAGQYDSQNDWGGIERPFNLRLLVPQQHRRAAQLSIGLTVRDYRAAWSLDGLSVVLEGGSERTSR